MTPNPRIARFGLKKTTLSLTDTHDCSKCKLHKKDVSPLYRAEPPKRASKEEKIIVFLHDYALGPEQIMSDEHRNLLVKFKHELDVDTIYDLPAVFCEHNKEPTKLMLTKCETRLKEHLSSIKPNVIVCFGKGPASVFNITGKIDKIKMGMFEVKGLPRVDGVSTKLIITDNLDKVLKDYSLRSQLSSDLAKAERLCSTKDLIVPDNYGMFESPQEVHEWIDKIEANIKGIRFMSADIETNGRHWLYGGKMRCISFCWGIGRARCIPFELDEEEYLVALKRLFALPVNLIWHNMTFDVAFLRNVYGVYSEYNFCDTMLDAFLLNPKMYGACYSNVA